jgi:hypothetical protein
MCLIRRLAYILKPKPQIPIRSVFRCASHVLPRRDTHLVYVEGHALHQTANHRSTHPFLRPPQTSKYSRPISCSSSQLPCRLQQRHPPLRSLRPPRYPTQQHSSRASPGCSDSPLRPSPSPLPSRPRASPASSSYSLHWRCPRASALPTLNSFFWPLAAHWQAAGGGRSRWPWNCRCPRLALGEADAWNEGHCSQGQEGGPGVHTREEAVGKRSRTPNFKPD